MAARKLQDLQVVVESNADWTGTVLAKPALSVVDVWPEWAGPCLAMRSQLIRPVEHRRSSPVYHIEVAYSGLTARRFKLKEAGDDLHLFSANASAIDCLSRFRDYSEPTWMFLGSGELVNVYVGCNKPRLLKLVRTELRKEQRVLKGLARRKVLPADKMSPAECERAAAQAARDLQARQEERDRADAALREVRLRQYRRIADQLNNYTVVLYLPHALEQGHLPSVSALQRTSASP
ncbi:LOW QUALITY PROTEIN: thioredoxin domain-containing protein 3 homolog [Thrips palmi]|uniref:LOW QUALITY PROTEIN: thioredoxin domain-containing protein 3 homolog n=1 Tax=Thrips palmi TaxID=161013 RepID=A0A6P8XWP2_THRPL|nr:LOW QUALITY PROTEIN: thioredoxin domain-containing protein 3 homolog [Thrips palmi]